jgi:ABC-type lipoprotein release transport system permease subunit
MLWNALNLAQREIRRNVLRSSLTTLGIIIGVSAVIIMVTLGNGATAAVTADIANLGSNLLTVMPGQRVGLRERQAVQTTRRRFPQARRHVGQCRSSSVEPGHERHRRKQESFDYSQRNNQRVLHFRRLAARERTLLQ